MMNLSYENGIKLIRRFKEALHFKHGEDPALERWREFQNEVCDPYLDLPELNRDQAKEFFRRVVQIVEIEPHGYCNRTCSFCTNAVVDRQSGWMLMPEPVFERILLGLKELKYNREVRFARYSEPLAHDGIFRKVAAVRSACPDSQIKIISNGDYIDEGVLDRLGKAGLTRLHVSIYLGKGKEWTLEAARHQIDVFTNRIGRKIRRRSESRNEVSQAFENEPFGITCNCANYSNIGFDRGGVLGALVDTDYVRDAPCLQVFHNLTIDYDGTVMPCCNVRGDIPEHRSYAWGDLSDPGTDLFKVFGGKIAQGWRTSLADFSEKKTPCRTCKQIIPSKAIRAKLEGSWRRRVDDRAGS